MRAVAGVYDVGFYVARKKMRRAYAGMAHHDHIYFHGQNIIDRI